MKTGLAKVEGKKKTGAQVSRHKANGNQIQTHLMAPKMPKLLKTSTVKCWPK